MKASAGGQHNEIGGEYRARLGALLATAVLLGDDLGQLGAPVRGVGVSLRAEADLPVDDLVVSLASGSVVCVQAKHRVSLSENPKSPFGKAIRQFVAAHRAPTEGPLVLAYAHGSGPLEAFGAWCESLRYAEEGVPGPQQVDAAGRFRKLAARFGVADEADVRSFAQRIHLWKAEPRQGDLYAAAMQRLAEAGVEPHQRASAFDRLADRVRVLAQKRAGDDRQALVDVLSRAGELRLHNARAPSVRQALLVSEYRERLVQRGRRLSAFGVPAAVADVELREGDADVHVQLPQREDQNSPSERLLDQALRRRGRVILLGGGGSGKSTALRALAAQLASVADSPLPLAVHWNDLKGHLADPLAATLAEATRDLAPLDAELLGDALRVVFADGDCALLLDGLDEVLVGREKLAATVKRWLDDVPASTEVVVATRPSAGAAIGVFSWPRLRLAAPRQPRRTARAIITAVARSGGCGETWIEERMSWVEARFDRDEELSATPLMVVLLATLAATAADALDLPSSRASVLIRVLEEVITRWEVGTRRAGVVEIGDLPAAQGQLALRRALFVFAEAALLRDGDGLAALRRDLQAFFAPMSEGRAQACVDDATGFWAATGLFSFADGEVRAQPRTLAEAALAARAIAQATPADELMGLRATAVGWQILSLIGLERVDVPDAWAAAVAIDGSADELVAIVDAHLDGARLGEDQIAQLIDSPPLVSLRDDREPDRLVEALLALELTPELLLRLRRVVEANLPLAKQVVIEAALVVRSPELRTADLQKLRRFFVANRPETRRGDDGVLRIDALDRLHRVTLQDVAVRLIGCSRADAELVASRLEKLKTSGFASRLRQAFEQAGYDDLAREAEATPEVPSTDWGRFGDFGKATREALQIARDLAEPRGLDRVEHRRLDELADLWATMECRWWSPGWIERRPDVLSAFMRIVAVLGGFDRPAVAAQAQQVLGELERDLDADDVIRDEGRSRPLSRWDLVHDVTATVDEIMEIFGRVPHECLRPLLDALVHAPSQPYVHTALLAQAPKLTRIWRFEATLWALGTAADPKAVAISWSRDEDVRRRRAVACLIGWLYQSDPTGADSLARLLLDDHDRGVQADAAGQVARAVDEGRAVSAAVLDQLRAVAKAPPGPFHCRWCDFDVPARKRSCPNCDTTGPEFGPELNTILGRERGSASSDVWEHLRESMPRRRVRSARSLD
jgi:hypothetical protein